MGELQEEGDGGRGGGRGGGAEGVNEDSAGYSGGVEVGVEAHIEGTLGGCEDGFVEAMVDLAGEKAGETVVVGIEGVEGEVRVDDRFKTGVLERVVGARGYCRRDAVAGATIGGRDGKCVFAGAVGVEGEGVVVAAKEVGEWGMLDKMGGVGSREEVLDGRVEGVEGPEGLADRVFEGATVGREGGVGAVEVKVEEVTTDAGVGGRRTEGTVVEVGVNLARVGGGGVVIVVIEISVPVGFGGEEAAVVGVGETAEDGAEGGVVGEEAVGVKEARGVEWGEALGVAMSGEGSPVGIGGEELIAEVFMEGIGEGLLGVGGDQVIGMEETKA